MKIARPYASLRVARKILPAFLPRLHFSHSFSPRFSFENIAFGKIVIRAYREDTSTIIEHIRVRLMTCEIKNNRFVQGFHDYRQY